VLGIGVLYGRVLLFGRHDHNHHRGETRMKDHWPQTFWEGFLVVSMFMMAIWMPLLAILFFLGVLQ
jgi:hypothetical protein